MPNERLICIASNFICRIRAEKSHYFLPQILLNLLSPKFLLLSSPASAGVCCLVGFSFRSKPTTSFYSSRKRLNHVVNLVPLKVTSSAFCLQIIWAGGGMIHQPNSLQAFCRHRFPSCKLVWIPDLCAFAPAIDLWTTARLQIL